MEYIKIDFELEYDEELAILNEKERKDNNIVASDCDRGGED